MVGASQWGLAHGVRNERLAATTPWLLSMQSQPSRFSSDKELNEDVGSIPSPVTVDDDDSVAGFVQTF